MSKEADKKRSIVEGLFPSEPLPGLIHSDNPEGRYEVWYDGLLQFKRDYLKGDAYIPHRKEINRFMKQGRDRRADSRMASKPLMEEAQNACIEWSVENAGHDSMELLETFRGLNKRWVVLPTDDSAKASPSAS